MIVFGNKLVYVLSEVCLHVATLCIRNKHLHPKWWPQKPLFQLRMRLDWFYALKRLRELSCCVFLIIIVYHLFTQVMQLTPNLNRAHTQFLTSASGFPIKSLHSETWILKPNKFFTQPPSCSAYIQDCCQREFMDFGLLWLFTDGCTLYLDGTHQSYFLFSHSKNK